MQHSPTGSPNWNGDRNPARAEAAGKFFVRAGQKRLLKGVTYGTFRPGGDGSPYPAWERVALDFANMSAAGANAVRVYTPPPRWLLDLAQSRDLDVLVGLPWEQHVAFLDDRERAGSIRDRIRESIAATVGHAAVMGYAVGNEIPASIVRWSGRRRVERFLEHLANVVREEDPGAAVTYANYPTTEYLELPFLDFVTFNVYLEDPARLEAYLARLQNLAGHQPLVLGELGLDSRRHGEVVQARSVERQLRTAHAAGCAGTFVFAWTDEWHRGGLDVSDWDFGLTSRDRTRKPSLASARRAWEDAPFAASAPSPRVSVVVCAHNAAATIRDCLEGVARIRYPNYETIVVDDGSTDDTAAIVAGFEVRLIRTENRGLSAARNTGLEAATGQIIAYIDADAWPDPDWLAYLADTFSRGGYVAVGGPNIPPPGDGAIADCVANAPGGPVHVLVSDREAEHIPGCNMAFWRSSLLEIGGFDRRFRVAGDDVDICWRLQDRGWRIAYNPGAVVWHHYRNTVAAYWKQQRGYGRAEALLEAKWPERYNATGHVTWGGRVYGRGPRTALAWVERVYHGTWGSAAFQAAHDAPDQLLWELVRAPEWYLVILVLAVLAALGTLWAPLTWAVPFLLLASGGLVVQAGRSARGARFDAASGGERLRLKALTVLLHLLQPLARLSGRLADGLSPWRFRHLGAVLVPKPRAVEVWTEEWASHEARLGQVEDHLSARGVVAHRGGPYDRWDLEIRGGLAGSARLRSCVEEHGQGRQLSRYALTATPKIVPTALFVALLVLATAAATDGATFVAAALGIGAGVLGWRIVIETGAAMYAAFQAIPRPGVVRRSVPEVRRGKVEVREERLPALRKAVP